ncbi:MAG TPA: molybdenum cofactor guanylyltransferase [Terracidiphilus sp.]|nr:molybdenum cofactor guanylyltransferase [Terracidiphilus sp.]
MTLPHEAERRDAAGFVLAGGRSSRMGSDKALLQLGGRPLISYALESLRRAGVTASIAGAASALDTFAPVIRDEKPLLGPLSGVCAALAATEARLCIFLAVDAPFIPPSLIRYIVRHAEVRGAAITLTTVNGFTQTFPAVIDRAVLPQLRASLESEVRGCLVAFRHAGEESGCGLDLVPIEPLAQAGQVEDQRGLPVSLWFENVNTPEDLRRAESHLTTHRVS